MAILRYALARIAVLLAVAGVLYLLGARSWLMWLGALVLAAMVSYVILPGHRNAAAGTLARQDDRRTRVDRDAEEEDTMLDVAETGTGEDAEVTGDTADADARTAADAGPDAATDADAGTDAEGSTLERTPEALEDAPTYHDGPEERDENRD